MKFEVGRDYAPHHPIVYIDSSGDATRWTTESWWIGVSAKQNEEDEWIKRIDCLFNNDLEITDPTEAIRLADAIKLAVRVMAVWNPDDGANEIEVSDEVSH